MPVTKIEGSCSIAWQSPSDRACAYVSLRIGDPRGSDMIEQRGDFGPGSVVRSFDVAFDICLHRLIPDIELRGRRNPQPREALGTALERASLHPGLDLLARSIRAVELMIEIRADVLAPTVGHAFEKTRACPGAQTLKRRPASTINLMHVIAVDAQCIDVEGPHAFAEVGSGGLAQLQRTFGRVEIVLAHEQDRQSLQRGVIRALVK